MGTLASITATFVANTKAKAAEVNGLMTEIFGTVNNGSREVYTNTYRNNRTSSSDMTWTGSDCAFFGYHSIATNGTYHLATSTARGICFVEMHINTGASLILNSAAAFSVIS